MGRKARNYSAAMTWLPGFEPDGYESALLGISSTLMRPAVFAPPALQTREVAVAASAVARSALIHVSQQAPATVMEALSVICDPRVDDSEPADPAPVIEEIAVIDRHWPDFDATRFVPQAGQIPRIEGNIRAIELLKQLVSSGTPPTDDQRHALLNYVGWGGNSKVLESIERSTLGAQHDRIKALLTEGEFASARTSTVTVYYTDPVIIKATWDIVQRAGFTGGRIIEPAAGTGLYLAGMPKAIALQSEITAVELDKLSGQILTTVFGGLGVKTHICGIEKANVPTGFYDLAISNVPFGEHKTLETRKVGYSEWSIHNYFFGKAVDLVRPGGLIVFITSRHTMDSVSNGHRKWLDAHAEMLGAIRLPVSAFKKQANTEAVTDIIVMRKRAVPMFKGKTDWLEIGTATHSMLADGQALTYYDKYQHKDVEHSRPINRWYVDRPHLVIGKLRLESCQYGRRELSPVFSGSDEDFARKLDDCVLCMPKDCYQPAAIADQVTSSPSLVLERVEATSQVRPGAFVVDNQGRICISEGEAWVNVDAAYKGLARDRLLGLIGLKETARRLLTQQANSSDDIEFKTLQRTLNVKYDTFVAKFGNAGDRANTRVFRTDPDCPLVLSLESYDEDNECYVKADIFSKRTVGRKEAPATAENAKDAMLISLALHGRIVPGDMAMRLNCPIKEAVQAMRDERLAYIDPADGKWKPADEYLSGNIRSKIAQATAAGKGFDANVAALNEVLPKDLGPAEVEVRLGAPWIPMDVIEEFLNGLIGNKSSNDRLKISYSAESAAWTINSGYGRPEYVGNSTLNNVTWGTSKRCAVALVEAALNQVPPKITKTVDGKTEPDRHATLAAREKYEAIKTEFKQWAYRDDARRDRLLRIYNDEFNQIVDRKYDGSHLVLYGMSGVVTPYPSQLDAIWRIITSGNTLLAHAVGAGKTLTMVAACMELRRLGKANKPCLAVPNHMLEQATGDFVRFYPNAKVLMASKEDFVGDKRREFAARIATGDWDVVVMTHATFEKIPLSPPTMDAFVGELLGQARLAISVAEERGAKRTVKQCEKLLLALQAKVERAKNEDKKDDFVYFDDLGIDHLCIDECHLFKNLMRVSKMPTIAGLPNVSSNRAFDLWAKTASIMQLRGGEEEGVTFASATPIANSVAELFTMMKFLQPNTLKRLGLYEFDAWAATFGETVQGMEVAPDGSGYRLNSRFSKFVNVADLMAIFRMVADIRTKRMLNLPTPSIKGGKPGVVLSPGSVVLKAYTSELVERADAIRSGSVKPDEDNMLAVTNCGRKAALDMRLIDPTLPFDPKGKVATACDNIVRIWKESVAYRGTQLVFCDLSTPETKGFSVYRDLRDRLIEAGIPAAEIAFIHDYDTDTAKGRLFKLVRAGVIRVLMGSTQKMGMGTNVQRRLKAVHQLDAPWRPADVEQRDGRGDRAGNECSEIELLRYITESSFDAYVWQLLELKMRFIEQIMTAGSGLRTVEDLTMGALTYAEIKAIASGNPVVLEKATVDAEVCKLTMLRDQWNHDRWIWNTTRTNNASVLKSIAANMAGVEADAQAIEDELRKGWDFKPRGGWHAEAVGLPNLESRIGLQILAASKTVAEFGESTVGTIAGMRLVVSRLNGLKVELQSMNCSRRYSLDRRGVNITSLQGSGELVLQQLLAIIDEPARLIKQVQRLEQENLDIDARMEVRFDRIDRLAELLVRQREIEAELELDKSEAGTETASESVKSASAAETESA